MFRNLLLREPAGFPHGPWYNFMHWCTSCTYYLLGLSYSCLVTRTSWLVLPCSHVGFNEWEWASAQIHRRTFRSRRVIWLALFHVCYLLITYIFYLYICTIVIVISDANSPLTVNMAQLSGLGRVGICFALILLPAIAQQNILRFVDPLIGTFNGGVQDLDYSLGHGVTDLG